MCVCVCVMGGGGFSKRGSTRAPDKKGTEDNSKIVFLFSQ